MVSDDFIPATLICEDTIVAIATPTGNGALGVVRLSGAKTRALLQQYCQPLNQDNSEIKINSAFPARKMVLCRIVDESGQSIDEGLVTFFIAPYSYTGEDVAELSLHGNSLLLRKVIRILTVNSGVRLANAGEFTRRAFLNGKLDLTQAEAVRRLIESRSEYELIASRRALSGSLKTIIYKFRSSLLNLKAEIEATIDFSTEDLTLISREEQLKQISDLCMRVDEILEKSKTTIRLVTGYQVALAGKPDVGKSSLLNLILGWERAIVSPQPGTTRDYLSEDIQLDGIALRIVDTAGIRESEDELEAEGVKRTRKEIERSQIVLHLIDGSQHYSPTVIDVGDRNIIYVVNKTDILSPGFQLPEHLLNGEVVFISCKTEEGVDDLKNKIRKIIFSDTASHQVNDPLLMEERQIEHMQKVKTALEKLRQLCQDDAPPEIQAIEIDCALEEIGEITGRVSTDEVLDRIFSLFCIGK